MEGSVSEHLEAAAEVAHTDEVTEAVEDAVEDAVEAVEDIIEDIDMLPTTAEMEHMLHECIREETPAIAAAVADVLREEFQQVEEAVEDVEEAVEEAVEEVVEDVEEEVEVTDSEEEEVNNDHAPEPDSPPERTHWLHRKWK